jgi:hypothetical protein
VRHRATTSLILALAAGVVIGCGGDDEGGDPLPSEQAAALERQLDSIENRFQFGGGACANITSGNDPNTVPVRSAIQSLPRGVDPEVRQELERGFERLFELVQAQCDEERAPEQPEEPVDTGPTMPPPEDDDDDDEEDEEAPPPVETGPTVTEPPVEVPPEGPTGTTGQGGLGSSGEGGMGSAGQGGDGGAIAPGEVP